MRPFNTVAVVVSAIAAASVPAVVAHGQQTPRGQRPDVVAASPTTVAHYSASAAHRFRGSITSSSRAHHWFRMHTTTDRRVRIYTGNGTSWDGCDWDSMRSGHHVDVRAMRSHGHWRATHIQDWDDDDGMMGW